MANNLDRDQIARLWEHGLHEDKVFNERLNFFLVFESVLIGVVASLYNTPTPKILVVKIVVVFGLLLTIVWGYVQARQKFILDNLKARLKEVAPEYSKTVERRKTEKWPISVTALLTYATPALVALIWIVMLFSL
jgi:hypothetical protein